MHDRITRQFCLAGEQSKTLPNKNNRQCVSTTGGKMKQLGLYVHIPFCVSKCKYCSFNSYSGKDGLQTEYIKAIVKEIKTYKEKVKDREITTIFIGGGTPSHLMAGGISTILGAIRKIFKLSTDCEITIEANPNSLTYEKVQEWKSAGINRVSIGYQTSKNALLRRIGRTHSKGDIFTATKHLHAVGLDNINIDLMIGLPTQKQKDVKNALNMVLKCGANHVSAYTLILEEGTPLYNSVNKGEVKVPKEEKTLAMYNFLKKYLAKHGFSRYEVSNFSLPGHECKHNINCWDLQEYIGFGAGAHSYYDDYRYSNLDSIEEYIKSINTDKTAIETREKITLHEEFEEYVMLGLRKTNGINLEIIKDRYNIDLIKIKGDTINKYLSLNMLRLNNNQLTPTDEGFNVLNKIILDIVY